MGRTSEKCEQCGTNLEAEFVDIGIGWEQVTEGRCPNNCDYIDYLYEEYRKTTEKPLHFKDWLDTHKRS